MPSNINETESEAPVYTRAGKYRLQTQLNDLKQHADKIIQGIKKIGPNHAKRAIWELFQNAVDLSEHCEVSITLTETELIFSHNGVPFTEQTLDCLFTQVSSKTLKEKKLDREEADPVGQYGTGFMTSHAFGDIIKVSGAILDEDNIDGELIESHIDFNDFVIDRSTQDWEKLSYDIRNLRINVEELLKSPASTKEFPPTVFSFQLATEQNKQRAIEAVNALRTILPYVMVFNERLEKVTVTDLKGDITTYVKDENEIIGQSYCSRTIHINDELKQINYLKSDKLTIVLPLRQLKDELPCTLEAEYLPDTLPKLFLFYPLIGTEDFGFNFVIHSKNFQPTEPRDALHLNSENDKNKVEEDANQLLLEEGSQLIFDFLENNLESIRDPHYLASINFAVESDDNQLNQYFSVFKEKWIAKFRKLPLVQTTTNRIAAENAIFLSNEILDNASKDTLQAIYRIIEKFYTNIPHQNLIPIWTQLVDEWRISDISRIGFSDIANKIHNEGSLENFSKEDLILLYKEILVKGHEGLFSTLAILPNIKGNLRKQIELSKTVELTKELIEIADLINPEISTRQVASDFLFNGLEFEPFGRKKYMELINSSLTAHLKDNTKSYELPQGYLQGLMQYSSITSKEGSTSGLIQIIKLIAQYYNLPFTQVILPSLPGDENIDVRKGQFDFFKLYLNDISEKDSDWVKENVVELSDILHQAFKLVEVKKYFLKYDVFPNQLFQLRAINDLNRDNGIPDFIKELYDKVVDSDGNIKSKLVHPEFQDLHDEMKPTNSLDLTRKIEQVFFGESENDIRMENHPFRSDIIEIIRNFKSEINPDSLLYEKYFPATFRNKSTILVQLADGEDSFSILSQGEDVIKKLAGIAAHPELDDLLKFGEDALRKKHQDEAELQYKKKIGNHLEEVLMKSLAELIPDKITTRIISEQDGQDLIICIDDKPVYFIEVKSKWLESTPIRISRNQTIRAFEEKNRYALCSIDMTKYKGQDREEVQSIDVIKEFMYFNTDIGERVEHLISIYQETNQPDKFRLDGDYRTHIPLKYIEKGSGLEDFENLLVEYLKKEHSKKS